MLAILRDLLFHARGFFVVKLMIAKNKLSLSRSVEQIFRDDLVIKSVTKTKVVTDQKRQVANYRACHQCHHCHRKNKHPPYKNYGKHCFFFVVIDKSKTANSENYLFL